MLTADDLSYIYASYTSALWRGDPASLSLEQWFNRHWSEHAPSLSLSDPAAVSPHGAGGRGIHWYESTTVILGLVPGKTGCYLVKRSEQAPLTVSR